MFLINFINFYTMKLFIPDFFSFNWLLKLHIFSYTSIKIPYIVFCGAGWIAVTPYRDEVVKMSFWTPKGRGVHVRSPSLLPEAVSLRGRKINKTPAYGKSKFVGDYRITVHNE